MNKHFKVLFAIVLVVTLLMSIFSIAFAKSIKPKVKNSLIVQVNKDVTVSYVDNKYMILRERLSFNKFKVTVIDKNSYTIIKKYNLDFGRNPFEVEWHGANGDCVPNPRFFVVFKPVVLGGTGSNYLVDILTGAVKKLPDSSGRTDIYPSPDGKGILYFTWNGKKGVQNISTGKIIDDISPKGDFAAIWQINKTVEITVHPAWNKDGRYLIYTKGGFLQLLDVSTMKTINLGNTKDVHFLKWTPNGKSLFYEEGGYIKCFEPGRPTRLLGQIADGSNSSTIGVSFNQSGQKAAIISNSEKMFVYNLTTGVSQVVYKPFSPSNQSKDYYETTWDVIWRQDDKDIEFILNSKSWAYAYDEIYHYEGNRNWSELKYEVKNPHYYKNYLLFLTNLDIMTSNGMGPKPGRASKLAVYDLVTKQLRIIDDITDFDISPDSKRVFVYKADEQPDVKGAKIYLLDEYKWKIGSEIPGFRRNGYLLTGGIIDLPSKLSGPVRYFDFTKVQIQTLFTVPQKQLCFPFNSQNMILFVIPVQKKVYIFDGHRLKSSAAKDMYLKYIWPYKAAPAMVNISPDEKDYCYLALIKGKTYLKINRI